MTDTPSRPVLRNIGLILLVLPVNALACAYGWFVVGIEGWAANKNGEPARLPAAHLRGCAAVMAGIGVLLWLGRARGAAVAQLVPLSLLAVWLLDVTR
ncbi:hypothetical protein ACWDYJ_06940 [Streptomyces sp. NPDC003042]